MSLAARFPSSFRFGAATAAYQIEGAVDVDGRGRSIWDTHSHAPARITGGDTGDVACDHYRRMEQDVGLMADLGLDAYRFSVAWPRIIPDGDGEVEPRGLTFYRRLVEQLDAAGIEPVVTLYHWDLPQALQDRGGWVNRATVDAFVRYAEVVQDALGEHATTFTTLNEPWCSAFLGYADGEHAPGLSDPRASLRAAHHLLVAHGAAVQAMRRASGEHHDLGIVFNLIPVVAASDDPADVAAAEKVDGLQNRLFLDAVFRGEIPADVRRIFSRFHADDVVLPGDGEFTAQPIDLLGINYYNRQHVAAQPPESRIRSAFPGCEDVAFLAPPEPTTAMGWGIEPHGLTDILTRVHAEYGGPPIAVCENGAAFDDHPDASGEVDDPQRQGFIERHLEAIADAIDEGVDVRAYYVWSLMDNFEWAHGYGRRFGIVSVDYDTQVRTIKSSGQWYRSLIAAHREQRPAGATLATETTPATETSDA